MAKHYAVTVRRDGKPDREANVTAPNAIEAIQSAIRRFFGRMAFEADEGIPEGDDIWVQGNVLESTGQGTERIAASGVRVFVQLVGAVDAE